MSRQIGKLLAGFHLFRTLTPRLYGSARKKADCPMRPHLNHLLDILPKSDYERIAPYLELRRLAAPTQYVR
jgi:hypothetical protein